jgi:hypothetical protein
MEFFLVYGIVAIVRDVALLVRAFAQHVRG